MRDVTELLNLVSGGDAGASDELLPLLDGELRRLAQAHLARWAPGHTLQPTVLIDEAFMELVGGEGASFESRGHFFALASRVIRSLLVDHARAKEAEKRGGGRLRIPLEEAGEVSDDPGDPKTTVLRVDQALEKLARIDPELARITEMRFFGGLGMQQIADVLGLPKRTVERRWRAASAWLRNELDG